jgi:hypothetical protein
MKSSYDPKFVIVMRLSILGIGLAIFACVYILNMFRVTYPYPLWLGRMYWPSIVLVTLSVPLFSAMALHLVKLMPSVWRAR